MFTRTLGRSMIKISAMGLGCWAIGGPFWMDDRADGWGEVDDAESIRALHAAQDAGINFFDTADAYGTGHSERVLGQAFAGRRSQVVIATKFGFTYLEQERKLTGTNTAPDYVRWACEASLRRLGTNYIDLYQLHCGASPEEAEAVADTLDELRAEGKIRAYAWSTDDPVSASLWAGRPGNVAVQHDQNVFLDNAALIAFCEAHGLASINRSPLAMGFLSGKFDADTVMSSDDVRGAGHSWVRYFEDGRPKTEFLQKLDAVREILSSEGRSLAQGALAWLWGRSPNTIPIPGFKTVEQATENAAAMDFGPLTDVQMQEIRALLKD